MLVIYFDCIYGLNFCNYFYYQKIMFVYTKNIIIEATKIYSLLHFTKAYLTKAFVSYILRNYKY